MIGALSGNVGFSAYSQSALSRLREGREQKGQTDASPSAETASSPQKPGTSTAPGQLSEEEKRIVDKLRQREAEVRAHEQAHKMAGGSFAGSPTYTTTQGPDGKRYITGGEVSIDISPEDDPEATIRKMEQIKRAALAPSDPSSQDRAVAMQAEAAKTQAQEQLNEQRQKQLEEERGEGKQGAASSENELATSLANGSYNRASQAYQAASTVISALQGVGVIA